MWISTAPVLTVVMMSMMMVGMVVVVMAAVAVVVVVAVVVEGDVVVVVDAVDAVVVEGAVVVVVSRSGKAGFLRLLEEQRSWGNGEGEWLSGLGAGFGPEVEKVPLAKASILKHVLDKLKSAFSPNVRAFG